MTVKEPNAKRESTDLPTNLRECAMLTLILHSHCYIGEVWGSDSHSPLLCTELAIVPSQELGVRQDTCWLSIHCTCLYQGKVYILTGLCQVL